MQLLLDEGIDTDVRGYLMRPALLVTAMDGLDETICILRNRGASIEAKDWYRHTALTSAIIAGQEAAVSPRLDRAANAQGMPTFGLNNKKTPATFCSRCWRLPELVPLLLD